MVKFDAEFANDLVETYAQDGVIDTLWHNDRKSLLHLAAFAMVAARDVPLNKDDRDFEQVRRLIFKFEQLFERANIQHVKMA